MVPYLPVPPENTSSHLFLDLSCMLSLQTILVHSDTMIVYFEQINVQRSKD